MYEAALLSSMYALATGYDLYTTRRRVRKYNINIETNASLRWAMARFGVDKALLLLALGHVTFLGLLFLFDPSNLILSFATGARVVFMYFQLQSLDLEKNIDALIALQKVPGRDDAATPSDSPSPPSE